MEIKKILVIKGSPREKGNTNTLCQAFVAGAMQAGHKVEIFDAATCNMSGCHGDQSCFERGRCGIQDDGVEMNRLMRWADILVLCSPVYWNGFTSQIKTVIDRFYQFSAPKGRKTCTVKEAFLISAAASNTDQAFDGIRAEFTHICNILHFTPIGEITIPGLEGVGAVMEHTSEIYSAIKTGYLIAGDPDKI